MSGLPCALEALETLEADLRGRPLAVFLDFDGTLTPIVAHPDRAVLAEHTRATLAALAHRAPVAVVSGRDCDDLKARVRLDGLYYAGSHGFEVVRPAGGRWQQPDARLALPALRAAGHELATALADCPGALLERKRFSLAVHYRSCDASGERRVRSAVDAALARHRGLRVTAGKRVLDLQPAVPWDKGRTVLWILEELGEPAIPLYVGDDITDEDAFRAVRGRGVGIRVGTDEKRTEAAYGLSDPTAVERFLRRLLDWL